MPVRKGDHLQKQVISLMVAWPCTCKHAPIKLNEVPFLRRCCKPIGKSSLWFCGFERESSSSRVLEAGVEVCSICPCHPSLERISALSGYLVCFYSCFSYIGKEAEKDCTMSQHSDEVVTSTDSFWEPGNYKRTTKRIEDGNRLCNDLIQLVTERAEMEKNYAKGLKTWAKKWNDIIEKGPEYGEYLQFNY